MSDAAALKVMFFIRIYLSLIQLVARKLTDCIDVAQPLHQRRILPRSNTASNTSQPVAEKFMQLGVLTSGFPSGKLNVSLVGIEDYFRPHDNSVHNVRALAQASNHPGEECPNTKGRRSVLVYQF
jgi:hypothetical protein